MTTREKIITAITNNKPALLPLPSVNIQQVTSYTDLAEKFAATIESIGGKVYELQNIEQLESQIAEEKKNGKLVVDVTKITTGTEVKNDQSAIYLEPVHKAYINGTIGVAENAAVWISESQMINRLLPFICQHLVIVLRKNSIVSTMHHAYQQINAFENGYGVFIAGPSKTADIEQSLVIGAHGARSLAVYLVDE